MTITMPVFGSTGRSWPAAGSPASGPRSWRPTRDDVPSPAATPLLPWKPPTCAPTADPDSNTVTNGLLLRADIHTLLDLRLLAPDPVTRTIVVSKLLAGTQYEALTTCQLADPAAAWQRPDQDALEITWQDFRAAEDDR